jgi:hypothetical protein
MKPMTPLRLVGLLLVVGLVGCAGKNVVKLEYQAAGIAPGDCTKSLSVVRLNDSRQQAAIGETNEGVLFYSTTDVADWVSRALYNELRRAGCRVDYHDKEYNFDTDYTLTGDIVEVYAKQASLTEYSANMRLSIALKAGGKKVFGKSYVSSVNKTTAPSPGANSKILTDLLQVVMLEMVPEIRKNLQ